MYKNGNLVKNDNEVVGVKFADAEDDSVEKYKVNYNFSDNSKVNVVDVLKKVFLSTLEFRK